MKCFVLPVTTRFSSAVGTRTNHVTSLSKNYDGCVQLHHTSPFYLLLNQACVAMGDRILVKPLK